MIFDIKIILLWILIFISRCYFPKQILWPDQIELEMLKLPTIIGEAQKLLDFLSCVKRSLQ